MINLQEIWAPLATEAKAALLGGALTIVGTIIGVLLTKTSEFVQISNRREKRANRPQYKISSSYEFNGNASLGLNDPNADSFDTEINLEELRKSESRNIVTKTKLNCKLSKYQFSPPDVMLDIFVKNDSGSFSFLITYYHNGFKYKDYFIGNLVNTRGTKINPSYQIQLSGPLKFQQYIRNKLLKK